MTRMLGVVCPLGLLAFAAFVAQPAPAAPEGVSLSGHWWKGNLHTHSFWSDGNDFPEMVVDWYKTHGYHFLALSDHNVLSRGEQWVASERTAQALPAYRERFGAGWVEERVDRGESQVRLKPLAEFRHLFEEPGKFLLVPAEEISDGFESKPIHVNATNLLDCIPPPGGATLTETVQNNVNAVLAQRKKTGRPMFPHVNHPNFGWALTAEVIAEVTGEKFFEIYNGHPGVRNYGDEQHAGVERMWDIILAKRLTRPNPEIIYGVAVDDAHHYHDFKLGRANPGRGWVMVRSDHLSPEHIIAAMEAGDFYASTGVSLKAIESDGTRLQILIEPEPGVSYKTQFIGTLKGPDLQGEAVLDGEGKPLPVTRRYGDSVGRVLEEVEGTEAAYAFKGDELYVRAKVISSRVKECPFAEGDVEVAWTQPVVCRPE